MTTNRIASIPARLAFGRPAAIPAAEFNATKTRKERISYVALTNNCEVLDRDGGWVLVRTSAYYAETFARFAGFAVWAVEGRPEVWAVDTSRIGVAPVNAGPMTWRGRDASGRSDA
jgi:hypothetical protein